MEPFNLPYLVLIMRYTGFDLLQAFNRAAGGSLETMSDNMMQLWLGFAAQRLTRWRVVGDDLKIASGCAACRGDCALCPKLNWGRQ